MKCSGQQGYCIVSSEYSPAYNTHTHTQNFRTNTGKFLRNTYIRGNTHTHTQRVQYGIPIMDFDHLWLCNKWILWIYVRRKNNELVCLISYFREFSDIFLGFGLSETAKNFWWRLWRSYVDFSIFWSGRRQQTSPAWACTIGRYSKVSCINLAQESGSVADPTP